MSLLFQRETDLSGLKENTILIENIIRSISIPTLTSMKGVKHVTIADYSYSSNNAIQKTNRCEKPNSIDGFVRKQMVNPTIKSTSPRSIKTHEIRSNVSRRTSCCIHKTTNHGK